MDYFVYILYSEKSSVFYKGYTSYPVLRLEEHNYGKSHYTANKGPWKMVYLEKMQDKKSALIRERQLKRVNPTYINWLINQESNIINTINLSG